MTPQELAILYKLTEAHQLFMSIGIQHPADRQEWTVKMHDLQRLIMAREAARNAPDYFVCLEKYRKEGESEIKEGFIKGKCAYPACPCELQDDDSGHALCPKISTINNHVWVQRGPDR